MITWLLAERYRRVHAELTQAHGVFVSANLVNLLMHNAAITGLTGPGKASRNAGVPTDYDLVNPHYNPDDLNELRVSDITERKTREGEIYCCAVLDTCSRKIFNYCIDSVQDSQFVVNALDMAIKQRKPRPGGVVPPITEPNLLSGFSRIKSGQTDLSPHLNPTVMRMTKPQWSHVG